jgi:hypothetical protein
VGGADVYAGTGVSESETPNTAGSSDSVSDADTRGGGNEGGGAAKGEREPPHPHPHPIHERVDGACAREGLRVYLLVRYLSHLILIHTLLPVDLSLSLYPKLRFGCRW